jgi:hypothetical protein
MNKGELDEADKVNTIRSYLQAELATCISGLDDAEDLNEVGVGYTGLRVVQCTTNAISTTLASAVTSVTAWFTHALPPLDGTTNTLTYDRKAG